MKEIGEDIMDIHTLYTEGLKYIATFVSFSSMIIIVWGVVLTLWKFIVITAKTKFEPDRMDALQDIRIILGSYILLGLEVLIAADIIETIAQPTFNEILLLVAIVLIRTSISFFLNKEIEAVERARVKSEGLVQKEG